MKQVIIMEDNIGLAMEWAAAFELNDCIATLTIDVEETVEYLQSGDYDLLITDLFINRPEGGLHLLRRLSTEKYSIPTIAVTGARVPNSQESDKNIFLESAKLLGAVKSIQKPFPAGELVLMAQSLWADQQQRNAMNHR